MKQGVGALIRQAGLQLMQLVPPVDAVGNGAGCRTDAGSALSANRKSARMPFMVLVTMGLCVGDSSPRLYALRLRHRVGSQVDGQRVERFGVLAAQLPELDRDLLRRRGHE